MQSRSATVMIRMDSEMYANNVEVIGFASEHPSNNSCNSLIVVS